LPKRITAMGHGLERSDAFSEVSDEYSETLAADLRITMTRLRRLAALMLALMILKLVSILRLLVRIMRLRRQEGPEWRRMIRMRIAFRLVRLSRAVLDLSGVVAPWLAGDAYFKRGGTP
jgi:hypothetical protein